MRVSNTSPLEPKAPLESVPYYSVLVPFVVVAYMRDVGDE